MRTTIELPDELFRRVKVRAAQGGLKMKDLITHYVEQGLEQESAATGAAVRQRSPLPIARQAMGRTLPALSNQDIQRLLDAEDSGTKDSGGRPD
jgi:plasmid stability protein